MTKEERARFSIKRKAKPNQDVITEYYRVKEEIDTRDEGRGD